eukprot:9407049-Alexandrium_andersonii.AAC.1
MASAGGVRPRSSSPTDLACQSAWGTPSKSGTREHGSESKDGEGAQVGPSTWNERAGAIPNSLNDTGAERTSP